MFVVTRMQEHLPKEELAAVKRVLYGANQGQPVVQLDLQKQLQQAAAEQDFDLQAYQFRAAAEQLRPARLVRIGLIQHGIVKPTTAPFLEQRQVSSNMTEAGGWSSAHGEVSAALLHAALLQHTASMAAARHTTQVSACLPSGSRRFPCTTSCADCRAGHLPSCHAANRGSWPSRRQCGVPAGGMVSRIPQASSSSTNSLTMMATDIVQQSALHI